MINPTVVYFVALTVLVVVVLLGLYVRRQPNFNPTSPQGPGQLQQSCLIDSCQEGLVCDGSVFRCRKPEGQTCIVAADCVTPLSCSGTCTSGPFGALDQACPCNPGYRCDEQSRCKADGGTPCNNNQDCLSQYCNNGTCDFGFPLAHPCTRDEQCVDKTCSLGYCQLSGGKPSGSLGAACAQPCTSYQGATCTEPGTVCSCTAGQNIEGICVRANRGIMISCTESTCSADLSCQASACSFPYPDPNALGIDGRCIDGMSASNSGCLHEDGRGCQVSADCLSGSCGGGATLNYYDFDSGSLSFPGSVTTVLSEGLLGLPGPSSPVRLISSSYQISGQPVDDIYLLDRDRGLWWTRVTYGSSPTQTAWQPLVERSDITNFGANIRQQGPLFLLVINDRLYTYSLIDPVVRPFNGTDGRQFRTDGSLISQITAVSISFLSEVLLVSQGVLLKKDPQSLRYSPLTQEGGGMSGQPIVDVIGNPDFSADSFFFSAPYNQPGVLVASSLLRFNNSSVILPTDRLGNQDYRCIDYSVNLQGSAIMLCQVQGSSEWILFLYHNRVLSTIPARVGDRTRVLCTENSFYFYTPASCGLTQNSS